MITWHALLALMVVLFAFDYEWNANKHRVNEITLFLVLLMAVLSGLRGNMGADLPGYIRWFEVIPPLHEVLLGDASLRDVDRSLEPGYMLYVATFKLFLGNFQAFMFAQSLMLNSIVVVALRRIRAPINIGLIVYFFLTYLSQFGQQRMAIVYVLCLLASTYVMRSEPKKFVVTVLIAVTIQYTAILFMPAYLLKYVLLTRRVVAQGPALEPPTGTAPVVRETLRARLERQYVRVIDRATMLKFFAALVLAWFVTAKLDVFTAIYDMLGVVTDESNIFLYKFAAYYQRISPDTNVLNAWFGISANIAILVFVWVYRKRWMTPESAPLFAIMATALLLLIASYDFYWIGDRVYRMYAVAPQTILFATLLSQKRRQSITMPFLTALCLYQYLNFLRLETGPYVLTSF